MAIDYSWILPKDIDDYGDVEEYEHLPKNIDLKLGTELRRYSMSGVDYALIELNTKKGVYELPKKFWYEDNLVPQRFHKNLCLVQGVEYIKPKPKKKKTDTNIIKERQQYVTKITKQCIRELNKKKYEFSFKLHAPRILFTNGKRSWYYHDGSIKISIRDGVHGFEYKRYHNDPIIGDIVNGSQEKLIAMHVAHEVAHYVHHMARLYNDKRITALDNSSHGYAFRMIYRYLRETIVNPMD